MVPIRIWRGAVAVLVWLCSILLAVTFARAGADKLSANGGFAEMFERWGYPGWFRVLTGVAEIAAAAMVLWPRLAVWGGAIALMVMIGAMGTRIVHGEAASILSAELLPALLAAGVILMRRARNAAKEASVASGPTGTRHGID
jgi:uncharacterized membrane protein YphA (DoxX/SURF4 family)